ncbi:MAG: hypothetical protein HY706_08545 [Candidatus Hydrogenedentes bacterium]|nr:hypothetical protein [Candidatus Hydrogenedentota bacterium]
MRDPVERQKLERKIAFVLTTVFLLLAALITWLGGSRSTVDFTPEKEPPVAGAAE